MIKKVHRNWYWKTSDKKKVSVRTKLNGFFPTKNGKLKPILNQVVFPEISETSWKRSIHHPSTLRDDFIGFSESTWGIPKKKLGGFFVVMKMFLVLLTGKKHKGCGTNGGFLLQENSPPP